MQTSIKKYAKRFACFFLAFWSFGSRPRPVCADADTNFIRQVIVAFNLWPGIPAPKTAGLMLKTSAGAAAAALIKCIPGQAPSAACFFRGTREVSQYE